MDIGREAQPPNELNPYGSNLESVLNLLETDREPVNYLKIITMKQF